MYAHSKTPPQEVLHQQLFALCAERCRGDLHASTAGGGTARFVLMPSVLSLDVPRKGTQTSTAFLPLHSKTSYVRKRKQNPQPNTWDSFVDKRLSSFNPSRLPREPAAPPERTPRRGIPQLRCSSTGRSDRAALPPRHRTPRFTRSLRSPPRRCPPTGGADRTGPERGGAGRRRRLREAGRRRGAALTCPPHRGRGGGRWVAARSRRRWRPPARRTPGTSRSW